MKKFKEILGMAMLFLGIITGIVCALMMVVNQIRNPDRTRMRLVIEYWDIVLIGILGCIVGVVGGSILARS